MPHSWIFFSQEDFYSKFYPKLKNHLHQSSLRKKIRPQKYQKRILRGKLSFLFKKKIFFWKIRHNRHIFRQTGQNFLSSEKYLSIYGVNFRMEPLQNASYVHQCGSYDEMVDFWHFFPTIIRHISKPMTSW